MKCFPQLTTGGIGQFPLMKRRITRAVVNRCAGGGMVKSADAGAAFVEWELALRGLNDGEWSAIEALFAEVEGRLGAFTFLDPADNLLVRSEELTAGAWLRDGVLTVAAGFADPFGGTAAAQVINAGQIAGRLMQSVAGPGGYQYCFSAYVRGASGTHMALIRKSGAAEAVATLVLADEWTRVVSSGRLESTEAGIEFGWEIPAGAPVEIFGAQVEAQVGASEYKATQASGGVYAAARFLEDSLRRTTYGADQHAAVVRIGAKVEA
jgi:hypothetical protein